MLKRLFDAGVSFLGFLAISPFLALISLLIKLDSKRPVFYRGARVGRFGKIFRIYKFRTMVTGADRIGSSSTPEDDCRITRVGRFLRKFKLDELPQLLNVLEGDMSFVGPRPQVEWAVRLYKENERKLLDVKPGITDHASLKFSNEDEILRGSTDPDKDYMEKIAPEKIKLGLEYANNNSFAGDILIIVRTLGKVLRR